MKAFYPIKAVQEVYQIDQFKVFICTDQKNDYVFEIADIPSELGLAVVLSGKSDRAYEELDQVKKAAKARVKKYQKMLAGML